MTSSGALENEPAPRILIVEDERIVAMDLAGTLTELGYAVAGMAARGEDAIEQAKRLNPNLILMDVRLAGKMDGIQAAQSIREERDVPVVYLTAHSDNDTLQRAANASASGYLVKPFKSPELRCVIEIALHKHAADVRMRENEQWLSTTLQSIAEGVIATDESGRVRLFNRIAEQLTGVPRDEATSHTVDEVLALIDEHTGDPTDNLVHKVLEMKTPVAATEVASLISRSGRKVAVEESAAPIVDPYGNLLGGVLVIRDVTERRQQLQQIHKLNAELEQRVLQRTAALEQANRELEAFSYSVAHDLRAPLRGIDGFSQMLIDKYAPQLDAEGVSYLNRVRGAAARMSELIDALLSLARVGRAELQATEVDLTRLAATLTQDLASGSPERRVKVRIDAGMKVFADPQLLRILLGNLLDNAWKFTTRTTVAEVEVGQCKEASLPTYFVRDNGAGFDTAYADKLFGAFERLHTEKEFPGTGIGLAIVHRIVTRHTGRIWADSAPGRGATFFFTLPPSMH
jgi:PAS domain S-box-containing protein